jgi:hypothetical protein
MDDNDVKLAATANKLDVAVNPGAVHVARVNARRNPCPSSLEEFTATTESEGGNDIDRNNRLIGKMQGQIPPEWNNGRRSPTLCLSRPDQDVTTAHTTRGIHTKLGDVQLSKNTADQAFQAKSRMHHDLEHGEYGLDSNEGNMAVALPVDVNAMFTPTAVEYDADAKSSTRITNRRRGLYVFFALSAVIIGIVGVSVGIVLSNSNTDNYTSDIKSPNQTTNYIYRERVAQFVGDIELDDVNNPYRKALDWISTRDPMLTTPENPRFIQRFILAYFYYATSANQPWVSDCAPSNDTDNYNCKEKIKYSEDRVGEQNAFKWLSNTDECEWAGLHCDFKKQIDSIKLGTHS